jgi:hypothetical protein
LKSSLWSLNDSFFIPFRTFLLFIKRRSVNHTVWSHIYMVLTWGLDLLVQTLRLILMIWKMYCITVVIMTWHIDLFANLRQKNNRHSGDPTWMYFSVYLFAQGTLNETLCLVIRNFEIKTMTAWAQNLYSIRMHIKQQIYKFSIY